MTEYQKLYSGISKVAWGYVFLYFDINLGSVDILPAFVGYLLFLTAIDRLNHAERELSLLRTMGMLLAAWHGGKWLLSWFGVVPEGVWQFVDILIAVVNLYFHFQLLTNLASVAAKYQKEGCRQDEKLLRYRTIQTVVLTAMEMVLQISSLLSESWVYLAFPLMIVYIIVGICLIRALFVLRNCLATEE